MAVTVVINIDTASISEKAIREALASRIRNLQRREEARARQQALRTRVERLTKSRTNSDGIEDMPTWNRNPPRIELHQYQVKDKSWNMFWYRYEIRADQGRARLWFTGSQGTNFRELNLDWVFDYEPHIRNGTAAAAAMQEAEDATLRPAVTDYVNSIIPDWLTPQALARWDDFPPHTFFPGNLNVIAGTPGKFIETSGLERWIYTPYYNGVTINVGGPFCYIERRVYDTVQKNFDIQTLLLPLIDDIAVLVVCTRGIVRRRSIDFLRRIQAGGKFPPTQYGLAMSGAYVEVARSVVIDSPFFYAQKLNGEAQTPVHEHFLGRVDAKFGQIERIVARMSPGNPSGADPSDFDLTQEIKFQIMKSKNMPDFYRDSYHKFDPGTAAPVQNERNIEWAAGTPVSPVLVVGTDPIKYALNQPSENCPCGRYNYTNGSAGITAGDCIPCSDETADWAFGYNEYDEYTETMFNYKTYQYNTQRVYRSWPRTFSLQNCNPFNAPFGGGSWGTYQNCPYVDVSVLEDAIGNSYGFAEVEEGDYLWVRIIDVRWGDEGNEGPPYVNSIHTSVRHTPWIGYMETPEEESEEAKKYLQGNPGRKVYGGYYYPISHGQKLFLDIYSSKSTLTPGFEDGYMHNVENNYTEDLFEETAYVMEDSQVDFDHLEPPNEPIIRAFVISDTGNEEIEPPNQLIDLIAEKYGKFEIESAESPPLIYEGLGETSEAEANFAWAGCPIETGAYGAWPGRNQNLNSGDDFNEWILLNDEEGSGFVRNYGPLPYKSPVEGSKTTLAKFRPHKRIDPPTPGPAYGFFTAKMYTRLYNNDGGGEYRKAGLVLGTPYVFSFLLKPHGTYDRDGGILYEQVTTGDCKPPDPYYGKVCIYHGSIQNGKIVIEEFQVFKISSPQWSVVWLQFQPVGRDILVIDSFTGDFLEDLDIEICGGQIESGSGGLPNPYEPRGYYGKNFKNYIKNDYIAKGNAVQTIGQEDTSIVYSFPAPTPSDQNISLGISGQINNIIDPVTITRTGPGIYDKLGAWVQPNLTYPGTPTNSPRAYLGLPWYNVGPLWNKENGTYDERQGQGGNEWWLIRAAINEKIEGGQINRITDENLFNGQNDTTGKARGGTGKLGENSEMPSFNSGELNSAKSAFQERIDGIRDEINGSFAEVRNAVAGCGDAYQPKYWGEDAQQKRDERDECEFIKDKNAKWLEFLKSASYGISDTLTRGNHYTRPYAWQYTSAGRLYENAEALRRLGFVPEEILGIGDPGGPV